MSPGIAGKLQLLKEAYNEWSNDNAPRLGAALAYYAVFSIPPMLLILLALARTVYGGDVSGNVESEFAKLINPDAAHAMFAAAANSNKRTGIFAEVVGFALVLFGASGVFRELKASLNTIWKVQPPATSGFLQFIRSTFLSFAMVLGSAFLLLVSLVLSAIISAIGRGLLGWLPFNETASHVVDIGLSFLIVTGIFALMYRFLPDRQIEWNDVWIGAAATAALFTIGKFLIGLYLGKAAVGAEYGAAGAVIVVIVWIYYSAQIFFMGAEFTKVYARHHGSQQGIAR